MLTKRIIPCLDIKNGKVVKGINFVELKDVGDPIELAKRYDQQCADEVVFLDITASYEERDIIKDISAPLVRKCSEFAWDWTYSIYVKKYRWLYKDL